jgi:methyltransferase (TIGR00027 family)
MTSQVREDRPSNTAVYVAMGRALAHARGSAPCDDPFALGLLPDDARAAVERIVRGERPRSAREVLLHVIGRGTERLMGPRTAEIDEGLRAAPPGSQLVILGAGLDARAYRMRDLASSVAFELDHPASQALKRRHVEALHLVPVVRELRHVPVDFTRERANDALARAGHDASAPTAWVFEGVISYLSPAEVEAALDSIAERSAPGSRLLATYNASSIPRRVVSAVTRNAGEPQRASFRPHQMHELLEARGFVVRSDSGGYDRARRWKREPDLLDRVWFDFHHVVVADRADPRAPRVSRAE